MKKILFLVFMLMVSPVWADFVPSAGSTAYDSIGDPTADGSIDFNGFTNTWTYSLDSGTFFKILNTDTDHSADMTVLNLVLVDDGDVNGIFLQAHDNADTGPDLKFQVDSTSIFLADEYDLIIGESTDSFFRWDTTQTNDSLQLGLNVGDAAFSGVFSIMEDADIGNANRAPSSTVTNPTLRVYSSDATQANDYIQMWSDDGQGRGVIESGNNLILISTANVLLQAVRLILDTDEFQIQVDQNDDETRFGSSDNAGNMFIFTAYGNAESNHDHAVQTDPTIFIQSDTDPNTNNTQWMSLYHDKGNAVIDTGTDVMSLVLNPTGGDIQASGLSVMVQKGTDPCVAKTDGSIFWDSASADLCVCISGVAELVRDETTNCF